MKDTHDNVLVAWSPGKAFEPDALSSVSVLLRQVPGASARRRRRAKKNRPPAVRPAGE